MIQNSHYKTTLIRKETNKDNSNMQNFHLKIIKGATKSYFTHYPCVVIILFNTALCR